MATVRPFRAIRPAPNLVHLIVSRSYISYDDDALSQKLASNPFSFIHVINPDHGTSEKAPPGSKELFEKVRKKYLEFYESGYFIQDGSPAYYVYRQSDGDKSFTGIICATASKDYVDGCIRRHELTLEKRERMFTEYLQVTGINAEPVLMTYPDNETIEQIVERKTQAASLYDFNTTDGMRHTVWGIYHSTECKQIEQAFSDMEAIYIADGHHRSASSARLTQNRTAGEMGLNQAHDFFMSYLVPSSQMRIEAFHRLLTLSTIPEKQGVLDQLAVHFDVTKIDSAMEPSRKGEMCISVEKDWYLLHVKDSVAEGLDVQRCSDLILAPIFGVEDLRNDKRISFVNGARGLEAVEDRLNSGRAQVAILLYPVQTEELIDIADRGAIMPPKSTWVEPKLRSALTIYSLRAH